MSARDARSAAAFAYLLLRPVARTLGFQSGNQHIEARFKHVEYFQAKNAPGI
jgi:hypothetical protein